MWLIHRISEGERYRWGVNYVQSYYNTVFSLLILLPYFFPLKEIYTDFDSQDRMSGIRIRAFYFKIRLRTKEFSQRLRVYVRKGKIAIKEVRI